MAATIQIEAFTLKRLALLASAMALLSSCAQVQSPPPPSIKVDGSSTVYPITQAVAKEFNFTTKAPVKVWLPPHWGSLLQNQGRNGIQR